MSAELVVRPLGGCGEVGLNATLFAQGDDLLLVDCGVSLATDELPGVERLVPDFSALSRPGARVHGVLITHGHEDHIGALPELFKELDVPVYGPPLAILLARARFERRGFPTDHLRAVPLGSTLTLGPFTVEWIRVTHSIPDAAALCVETSAGRVLHSGDFKLDRQPVDGRTTDLARLAELAARGVDLLLADSTNAERPGRTRSETEVGLTLETVARECTGRLLATCFASHLHRLQGLARAARASGRRLVLLGGALHRAYDAGTRSGHLDVDAQLADDYATLAKHKGTDQLVVVTGAQGEARAALGRVALERALPLGHGDTVVLSTSVIPGNERAMRRVVNALALSGARVVDDGMCPVHCSGHAHQEEQAELIAHVRPRWFVPIHGDRAMLEAHARTARAVGVERTLIIEDGESVVLAGGEVHRGDVISTPARAIDASTDKVVSWPSVDARRRLSGGGLLSCAVLTDARGQGVTGPVSLSPVGWDASPGILARLEPVVREAIAGDEHLDPAERVRLAVRRELKRSTGQRPHVEVHVLRGE